MVTRTAQEWEDRFRSWAGGPGDTELERCANAERMIRKAIDKSAMLNALNIEVFAQGSFRNITNIAQESDVDVSVCLRQAMFYELPDDTTPADFQIEPTDLEYESYRQAVTDALITYFGKDGITVGNKAIRIHSNTYRVDADVVPNWEFRQYFDAANPTKCRAGVRFWSVDGKTITNYPEQHIEKGTEKNGRTSKRFKRMARIVKTLQVEMLGEGIIKNRLPSFLIESLVYNVPDDQFGSPSYRSDVRAVLAHVFNNTRPMDDCSTWVEVNDVKYLFHPTQPWTKEQAHAFASEAWDYIGFD
ncbi:MAG: nucleotidyltransferase [Betaproteobacteria bacterium]|nr:nucleotidyltransferase [Betaproteobacteria bacterium]